MITRNTTYKFLALSALSVMVSMTTPVSAETTGRYIDDATITAKVKESIFADSQLKVLQIEVMTDHGVVTLSGTVNGKSQEDEAVKVAKLVDGAKSVRDNLSIKTVEAN